MRKQRERLVVKEKREILVFVYGSLKKYGGLSGYLDNSEFVGDAHIPADANFIMRDLGAYPALQIVAEGAGNSIQGELYIIDHTTLDSLDKAEGFPHLYNRDLIYVTIGDNQLKAWVYYIDTKKSLFEVGTLTLSAVVKSGEWDAVKGSPMIDTNDFSELDNPSNTDFKVMDDYQDLQQTSDYADSVDFIVEGPVYISSEHGEYWGPFASIDDALTAVHQLDPTGVNVLTIGFRMIRKNLSDHELADINTMTENLPF